MSGELNVCEFVGGLGIVAVICGLAAAPWLFLFVPLCLW